MPVTCTVQAQVRLLAIPPRNLSNNHAAPRYVVAMSVNCAMCAMSIIAAIILRIILVRLNHKLDQGIYVKDAVNTPTTKAGEKGFRFNV